jgi:hypothetical protein
MRFFMRSERMPGNDVKIIFLKLKASVIGHI